jgi:hypothetical protein
MPEGPVVSMMRPGFWQQDGKEARLEESRFHGAKLAYRTFDTIAKLIRVC